MTTNEMKTILYDKLCDECCYFTKSDISIKKHGQEYRIAIKDYECIPFKMFFEYDDYFGYIVYIDTENESDLSSANGKFEKAALITPENAAPASDTGWESESTIFGNFGGRWIARSKDGTFEGIEPLRFEVEAKNIGVFYSKLTSMGGTFDVVVDGQVAKTIDSRFPGGWGNYVEAEEVICFPETGKHTVEIVPHTGEKSMVAISAIAIS